MAKKILLVLLALAFIGGGTMHFVRPDFYVAIMPPFLPAPLALVYISGAAEIAGGIGVLIQRTRRLAGWGLIALLIAVFPANLYVAIDNVPMFGASEGPGIVGWIRLPFQAVFIAWVWWVTIQRPRA